ncbi:Polysaccharide deacetylase [Clostridium cavendishii DSM 21758]|uniref:Polysaccharide deacetylase n=1 Tax=Clostridium cavendishii DSM 21758 TaxID=1121302 RepID=A0A1M6LSL4_9CLOT|nr:polysaccharide deacetylase family protein [Clostridium cavendishii]SHJ74076.1 Polysaccharide deacetylase [Clostridium cavendishii DSM 21758]
MKKNSTSALIFICTFLVVSIVIVMIHEKNIKATKTNDPTNTISSKEDKPSIAISENRFEGLTLTNKDIGIPVICYHAISESTNNDLLLSPKKFEEQLNYLKENNYTPITMDELYGFLKEEKEVPEKSVVLTFDDGYKDNYTNAFPILKKFNFKATIYVISDSIEDNLYLTKEQIKEMSDYGIDIESHTQKHDNLSTLNLDKQYETMLNSKEALEKITKKTVSYIAYPFGKYNPNTRIAAEKAGYKLGFNLAGGLADKHDNAYNIDRLYIGGNYTLSQFISKISKTHK